MVCIYFIGKILNMGQGDMAHGTLVLSDAMNLTPDLEKQ
jgi:hypothetical protein